MDSFSFIRIDHLLAKKKMSDYFVPMLMIYFVKIKKVFNKFVQVGRVVQINYGADKGKLAVIVNIVNQNRILIDGEHIVRQVIPIRRIHLTKFQIENVELNQRTVLLKKKIAKFDLTKKYAETSYAKKQAAKAKRANLGDFDRFRVMVLKKKLARTSAKSK